MRAKNAHSTRTEGTLVQRSDHHRRACVAKPPPAITHWLTTTLPHQCSTKSTPFALIENTDEPISVAHADTTNAAPLSANQTCARQKGAAAGGCVRCERRGRPGAARGAAHEQLVAYPDRHHRARRRKRLGRIRRTEAHEEGNGAHEQVSNLHDATRGSHHGVERRVVERRRAAIRRRRLVEHQPKRQHDDRHNENYEERRERELWRGGAHSEGGEKTG